MMPFAGSTARPGLGRRELTAPSGAGVSLLFAPGQRPMIDDFVRLLDSESLPGQRARVTCRSDEGWLELLAGGLAFDLTGLAPARSDPVPGAVHCFGIAPSTIGTDWEAITLLPGDHAAGGKAMVPLVRAMIAIAVGLALPLPVKAVCWKPAGSWMAPDYFTRVTLNWLSGGGFPAMGLTALETSEDGSVASDGLGFFVGQELRIEPAAGIPPADNIRLAVRVIDHVVRHGPLTSLSELNGGPGDVVLAEPSANGTLIRVWRGGQPW